MKLAIIHPLPLLDASLDSTTLAWLIGSLVVVIVLLVAGVLATAPARRRERAASLSSAAHAPTPSASMPAPAPAPIEAAPTPAPVVAAPPASAPEPDVATTSPSIPVMPAPAPDVMAAPAQAIAPTPAMTDFSASGPIMLPSSVVEASFGPAAPLASPSASGSRPSPMVSGAFPSPAPASASSSFSGPLMPPPSVSDAPPAEMEPAPTPAPAAMPAAAPTSTSANGSAGTPQIPEPTALDLFAHIYGRTSAAMLSATERAAARRITRALHDDPLAVQLAALYAVATQRPLDGVAQFLEADRRSRMWHESEERPVLSDAAALDLFAHTYGRTSAAMLSATERAAAERIVHALGADPLAVRLAALYAAETQRPLDGLAGQVEANLRQTGAQSNGSAAAASSAPDVLDLFARAYGRHDAAMLSATERAAARRIIQALNSDSAAVREAVDFAITSHQSLDGLAGRLEAERRSGSLLHA